MAKQVEKKFDVICLGGLVADVLTKPVDSLPEPGTLQPVERTELHLGGCAANAAVDLAILGVKTAIIGKVGDDDSNTVDVSLVVFYREFFYSMN